MPYLLDANACIGYLRGRPLLVQRINARLGADAYLCSVVKAELIGGALRSRRPAAERAAVDAFANRFVSLPFNDAAAEEFARIRFHLESLGMVIGPYDLQIASIALANQQTVVTHNIAEFGRVPGLTIEDWEVP
jgi:tRNA(fMet)-specific endonuclease VapC